MAIRARDLDRRLRSEDRPAIARSLPAGLALIVLLGAGVAPAGADSLVFVEALFDGVGGVNGLAGAISVAVSPDGEHVYVAGRFDGAVAVFQRNAADGTLTFLEVEIDGTGGVDGLTDVTSVAVSPDGEHLYAASNGDQAVAIFDRGAATGLLTFVTSVSDTLPDAQIDTDDHRNLTLSPDGAHLYVANHVEDLADGWIATFERDPASGLLTPVPPVLLGDEIDACTLGIEGDSRVAVSADGTRAYANLTFDASVTAFERNPATGQLTVLASVCDETIGMGGDPAAPDGLWGAQGVALDPEGRHVYVAAGNLEDAVAVLLPVVFADGFESGDTSAWTSTVP